MESRALLEDILPSTTAPVYLGVLDPDTKKWKQKCHSTLDSLLLDAEAEQKQGMDVYFTPAVFSSTHYRTQNSATKLKSFFLDLDVGDQTGKFATIEDAAAELKKFVSNTGLPKPCVVHSGGGLHVYWVLTSPINKYDWFLTAKKLKDLCKQEQFSVDFGVVADAARCMRLIGSVNHKRNSTVTHVITSGALVTHEEFDNLLTDKLPALNWLTQAKTDWMRDSLITKLEQRTAEDSEPPESRFRKIAHKCLGEDASKQCLQLRHILQHQDKTPEPLWRAGLSIAWCCSDSDTAIHLMSDEHPEYDEDKTTAKAMGTKGPYRCATFDDINPNVCNGCSLRGKITSPISLGRVIGSGVRPSKDPSKIVSEVVDIPALPKEYFIAENGHGLFKMSRDVDGEPMPVMVAQTPFWLEGVMRDPQEAEYHLWFKSLTQNQGVESFTVPRSAKGSSSELLKILNKHGLIFDDVMVKELRKYIYAAEVRYSADHKALDMVNQFGWASDYRSFVVGDKRIQASGDPSFAPPSHYTAPLLRMYAEKGSVDNWKKAAAYYCQKDPTGYPYLTAVLAAFGSVLMPFTNKHGGIISLFGKSGRGKTTAQRVGLSAFGDPRETMLTQKDTPKSRFERAGVVKNLPIGLDELTLIAFQLLQQLTYGLTEGKSGNQARVHGGGEKISDRTWALIATSSSNNSLKAKLSIGDGSQGTAFAEANMFRIFELRVTPQETISEAQGREIEDLVLNNYGGAGLIFVAELLKDVQHHRRAVYALQEELNTTYGIKSNARFYVAMAACCIHAAKVLKKIGLMDVPLEEYTQWFVEAIRGNVETIRGMEEENGDPMDAYLRQYQQHIAMVMNTSGGLGENKPVIRDMEKLRTPIMGRYEDETTTLFIPVSEFRKFCTTRAEDYTGVVNDLFANGKLVDTRGTTKRLMTGLLGGAAAPPVRCLEFRLEPIDGQTSSTIEV